jgi:EAL domain-containing protein (putative c-di-GMP-specific phosphodiesterase class I)/anti-sigma regulatory factor (Ser/Thr protein kinase)
MTDVRAPHPGQRPAGTYAAKGKRSAAAISLIPAVVAAAWAVAELLDGHAPMAAVLAAMIAVWVLLTFPWADGGEAGSGFAGIRRMRMIRAVRRGMANGELELHYQPQIDLATGRPYGAEALLRWRRRGALVPPGEFLPAVESSDLIGPVTERVLKLAAAQAAAWRRAGRDLRVAVNLSGSNLRDFRVVSHIESALAAHDLPADAITVEVTETTVLDNPEQTRAVLDAIAGLGVPISVDDFGAGYSSLLWLRIFPVEEVKIDRSFVSQLSGDGRAFVEGVVRLARDLALRVVAEGIEDRDVLAGLHALGCDAGQGFLFARPMPAEQLERWLDAHGETDWARQETGIAINPSYEEIGVARDLVAESAVAAGLSDSDVWDVRVAVTEALANAIEHGTPTGDGRIHVRIAEDRDELQLEVVGGGRAPGDRPPDNAGERGRGIAIMSGTMDSVHLAHDDDRDLIRLAKKIRRERGVA